MCQRSAVVLLVAATVLAGATTLAAFTRNRQAAAAESRVVHIVAERFSFTPSEVTVIAGTRIEFRLTSEDTAHGFRILGPGDVNVVIPKRRRGEAVTTFDAIEPGDYVFECSRMCGAGHSFMRGRIRVRPRK
jgi:cytochrome c oxidase subunit 2